MKFIHLKLGLHTLIDLTNCILSVPAHCVNFEAIRYDSASFNRTIANKLYCVILALKLLQSPGDFWTPCLGVLLMLKEEMMPTVKHLRLLLSHVMISARCFFLRRGGGGGGGG